MIARRIDSADRDPHPLAKGLDQVTAALGMARSADLSAIFGTWDDTVGPTIAAHATPVGLHDGELALSVDHPGWATQLRHLEQDLLRRLDEAVGPGVVGSITIRVGGS